MAGVQLSGKHTIPLAFLHTMTEGHSQIQIAGFDLPTMNWELNRDSGSESRWCHW